MNRSVGQTPIRGTVMRFDKKPGEGDTDEEDWGEDEDEDDEDDEEEEWEEEW